jgi:hypothetical protein
LKHLAFRDLSVTNLYRREMKTIRNLGQLDKIFGVLATRKLEVTAGPLAITSDKSTSRKCALFLRRW